MQFQLQYHFLMFSEFKGKPSGGSWLGLWALGLLRLATRGILQYSGNDGPRCAGHRKAAGRAAEGWRAADPARERERALLRDEVGVPVTCATGSLWASGACGQHCDVRWWAITSRNPLRDDTLNQVESLLNTVYLKKLHLLKQHAFILKATNE